MPEFDATKKAIIEHYDSSVEELEFYVYNNIAFTGLPDGGPGTDSIINFADARKRFGETTFSEQTIEGEVVFHGPDIDKLFTQLPILESKWVLTGVTDTVEHSSWNEPSLSKRFYDMALSGYAGLASSGFEGRVPAFPPCAFMGSWVESAPIIAQSSLVGPGPATFTYTGTVSETKTRTDTTGESLGGTISGSLKPPGGVELGVSGTVTYNRSVADSYGFTATGSEAIAMTLEVGQRGRVEIRLTGARYGGLLLVYYPKGFLPARQDYQREILNELDIAIEGEASANPVLEQFPIRVMAKGVGADLSMTHVIPFRTASSQNPPPPESLPTVSQEFISES
ncbi:hypothetical protein ABZ769_36965 [Streptomyces olivoreticuli]